MRRHKLLAAMGYLLVAALILSCAADHATKPSNDWRRFDHQRAVVTHVTDGDTLRVGFGEASEETTVRLLGIDAPELTDVSTGRPAHWADRARKYVEARAAGKTVTLRLEPTQSRDRYDRLLAYVYLSDGDCLNLDIVRDGQAYADRRFRHSYRPQYEMAENEARRKKRGLWKDVTEDQMPPWRRAWLHERNQ